MSWVKSEQWSSFTTSGAETRDFSDLDMARVDAALRPFRNREDNLDEFWQKFQVVCNLQKHADGKARMGVLPLYLTGEAFTVWSTMEKADQEDEDKVQSRLAESFSMLPGEAYSSFVRRKKRVDESVDAYLADLRRLMRISGHKEDSGGKDPMLVEQFLVGMPKQLADQLRLSNAATATGLTISAISSQARALCAAAAGCVGDRDFSVTGAASHQPSKLCYECQQTGHVRRECPKLKRRQQKSLERVQCYQCKEYGHYRSNCPQVKAGTYHESPQVNAAATTGGKSDVCLGTVARTGVALPKIFVNVREGNCRLRAAIDSCSNRSLISSGAAAGLACSVLPTDLEDITAIDGKPVRVVGAVQLCVSRQDDHVYLPEISAQFLVVDTLSVVQAELLIGLDVISSLGGVSLQYDGDSGVLTDVVFGAGGKPTVAAAANLVGQQSTSEMPRHVTVVQAGADVTLEMSDGEARFDSKEKTWEMRWQWKNGEAPTAPLGSGVGQYSRAKLSPEQEAKFCSEVNAWIDNGWLVPYDADHHGPPGAVLPLLAVCQEHKATTPVRPCLDYRLLNDCIVSNPGKDAPVCGEKIRKWRQRHGKSKVIDIRKAYLNVRVHLDLQRFQMVVWEGQQYVMERMGFGLAVAPKVMNAIVKWVVCSFPETDNYIDDIVTPEDQAEAVTAKLESCGLPTKPPVDFNETSVLGLKLSVGDGRTVAWQRREGVDLSIPPDLTRRGVFRWCGRLTSHYPVCSWLRPLASWLKRLAVTLTDTWDCPVPQELQLLCREVEDRVGREDPVRGVWTVPSTDSWKLWCDASGIAYGVVLQADQVVLEDQSWLRPGDDKRHINVAELDAVIRGLNLAANWGVKKLIVVTDSQTVYGWLRSLLGDVKRVRATGLNQVLVERRLQIVDDLISTTQMDVSVDWVPSQDNLADRLTRVPGKFIQCWKTAVSTGSGSGSEVQNVPEVVVASANSDAVSPLSLPEIYAAQQEDEVIMSAIQQKLNGDSVTDELFQRVKTQLVVVDNILMRSIKLPLGDIRQVPVIPAAMVARVLRSAHLQTGHAGWERTWRYLQQQCYFAGMAEQCQGFVKRCSQCAAASPKRGEVVPPTRDAMPGGPWTSVQIDTLELGYCHNGQSHCVLVCIDMFSKWVEVLPLKRHDAASVAAAFVSVCARWGPPTVVRSDNGSEFVNAVMTAVFEAFGVHVRHGAVRHPQSQGMVERFNRTLLTLIRKTLEDAEDWKSALDMLVYFYRIRPHASTKLSPMEAMVGWEPGNLLVQRTIDEPSLSAWVDRQKKQAARIRDHVQEELSALDFIDVPSECPFQIGDHVLLRRPNRHQKRQPPFESGWQIQDVIAPSTVVIISRAGGKKTVNVDILKIDPQASNNAEENAEVVADVVPPRRHPGADPLVFDVIPDVYEDEAAEDLADVAPAYNLRNRSGLQRPSRFL